MSSRTLRYANLVRGKERFHLSTIALAVEQSELHDHDFAECFWVLEGAGVELTPDGDHRLTRGSLGLVRASDRHRFASSGSGMRFRNLAFPADAIERHAAQFGETLGLFDESDIATRRVRLSADGLVALEAAARPAVEGRRDRVTLQRLLLTLSLLADPHFRMADDTTGSTTPAWLTQAMADGDVLRLGVEALVERCGKSAEHVARTCRETLGVTPTELVTRARLDHAAELLAQTRRPVLDVCYDSGFHNVGHFHVRFKQRFHTTPGRYRNAAASSTRTPVPGVRPLREGA